MSSARRGVWAKKFARLTSAETAAREATLVAVFEATQGGVSQADIAYMLGGVSPSCIKGRAEKGRKILEGRKRT